MLCINIVLRQKLRKHLVVLLFQLYGAGQMKVLELTFEPLLGTGNYIEQILPDDFPPHDHCGISFLIHDLLIHVIAVDPSFDFIKDAEGFIIIFDLGVLLCFVAKMVFHIVRVLAVCHAHNGRQHGHPLFP